MALEKEPEGLLKKAEALILSDGRKATNLEQFSDEELEDVSGGAPYYRAKPLRMPDAKAENEAVPFLRDPVMHLTRCMFSIL